MKFITTVKSFMVQAPGDKNDISSSQDLPFLSDSFGFPFFLPFFQRLRAKEHCQQIYDHIYDYFLFMLCFFFSFLKREKKLENPT